MDRNLGAFANNPASYVDAAGLIYQWGRKDPFPSTNEDNVYTPTTSGSFISVFPIKEFYKDASAPFDVLIEQYRQNPATFVKINYGDMWRSESVSLWGDPEGHMNLANNKYNTDVYAWSSDKSVYDPCPEGYRMIAGKAAGAENVVRVKAAVRDFPGETNFSVITADGCFYPFDVAYADQPAQLSIEMEDWLRRNPEGSFANDRMFVRLKELGDQTPVLVNRIMYSIYKKNVRQVRHIGSKEFGIQALLKGIYVHNDLLYLHTSLRNYSNLSFDIDYIRFTVKDKKVVKRTAMQESEVEPVRTFNNLTTVDGKATVRNVFVLPEVTIPDDKVLVVEIYERNGGRHQRFDIENTDLAAAQPIDELKLK